jgi:ParB family chromosome partitioning protein
MINPATALAGLDVSALMADATGKPLALPVNKIDFDPDNVRGEVDAAAIKELAASIKAQGVLQAISVRSHPTRKGRYIVNMGERRLRAVLSLAHDTINAYLQETFNPYAQVVENIQREDLSVPALARFVASRVALGENHATIARGLGKPASYVSELATIATAPKSITDAYHAGRIPDARTAYLLTKAHGERPGTVRELLAGDRPLTRQSVSAALATPDQHADPAATEKKTGGGKVPGTRKPWNAFAVEVGKRKGRMLLRPGKARGSAVVLFDDGLQETVALRKIKLNTWTTT